MFPNKMKASTKHSVANGKGNKLILLWVYSIRPSITSEDAAKIFHLNTSQSEPVKV